MVKIPQIPTFEVFITFLSYSLAFMLFVNQNLFEHNLATYETFKRIGDEWTYGLVFIVAATIKLVGILIDIKGLRIIGLVISAIIYATMGTMFMMGQSIFLPIILFLLTITCMLAIATDVKYTKL